MSTENALGIALRGIGEGLSSVSLQVPKYQRAYAWEHGDVNALFQDVGAAIQEGATEYFLGSVLVRKAGQGMAEVVDGQQRLATTMILLAAIRNFLLKAGDEDRAKQIATTYLCRRDLLTQHVQPNLSLSAYDNAFFHAHVVEPQRTKPRSLRDSHVRISRALEAATTHVEALAAGTSDPSSLLAKWVLYFHHNVKVIWLEVPDHANAFRIFETLNARGQELSPVDLLKNHVFGRVGDQAIDEVQTQWTQMLASLESVGGDQTVLTFLRHYWASKHGPTRDRELYKRVSEGLVTKRKCLDFCAALVEAAERYAAILSPTKDRWSTFSESARRRMETLNVLRMEQCRPLLLACLHLLSPAEVAKVLKYLVSASVRFLVVGGLGGGTMESVYSQAAVAVSEGRAKSAAEVRTLLATQVPADSAFEAAFATGRVSQAYLARYYLQTLERQHHGDAEPEFVPNDNPEEVNLEHILPEVPSAAWGGIPPDVADAYFNRMGNLALMKTRPNTAAANKGFDEKKKFYKKSSLELTKVLARKKAWTQTDIEARQLVLAKLAVNAWSLKF